MTEEVRWTLLHPRFGGVCRQVATGSIVFSTHHHSAAETSAAAAAAAASTTAAGSGAGNGMDGRGGAGKGGGGKGGKGRGKGERLFPQVRDRRTYVFIWLLGLMVLVVLSSTTGRGTGT